MLLRVFMYSYVMLRVVTCFYVYLRVFTYYQKMATERFSKGKVKKLRLELDMSEREKEQSYKLRTLEADWRGVD